MQTTDITPRACAECRERRAARLPLPLACEACWEIADFIEYCCSFYQLGNAEAVYPFATRDEITAAALVRVRECSSCYPFEGDSTDREQVRDLIEDARIEAAEAAGVRELETL